MAMLEIDWRPQDPQLRSFALIGAVFAGLLGAYLILGHAASLTTASIVWGIGAVLLLLGLTAPRAVRPVYLLLTAVSLPVGWLVSHVLLASMYYLILTPIGLIGRVAGRDALQRKLRPEAATYWQPRDKRVAADRYFRQY